MGLMSSTSGTFSSIEAPSPISRLGRGDVVHDDHRRGVALVDDPIEGDVTEPAPRLRRLDLEPLPVVVDVAVGLAVRLDRVAGGDERVVQASEVNPALGVEQPRHLLG